MPGLRDMFRGIRIMPMTGGINVLLRFPGFPGMEI
jgi:hypothetical protein